jgi:putative ABC transport system substrate-binding protein
MRRREFITLIGGAAVAWPLATRAQQSERMRRVGVVMGSIESDPRAQAQVAALRHELQKLGWVEGRDIRIDVRFASADPNQIRTIAAELMSLTPDLIVSNTNLVTAVLQAEVRTLPIVFISVGDPVGSGFVSNEARPTGNLTGFANWEMSMGGKWMALLKEVAPQLERVGLMLHPETAPHIGFLKSAEAAAPLLKVKLVALGVHDADEIERTVTAFAAEGDGGFVVAPHALMQVHRNLIIALAARFRLPALYPFGFYVKVGGLISYSFDEVKQFQQAAGYVDRILRGTKPADLPVQYPTKYELGINLKTAKALGLTVPQSLLTSADEVIE